MPPPFTLMTRTGFAQRVKEFNWTRKITAVHMHHTWKPNHSTWQETNDKHDAIVGMYRFHITPKPEGGGMTDIAQNVTIDPDGGIWVCRDWNKPPASNGGANGTSDAGPFMFEMIGNFDKGHEVLTGEQRLSAIGVIGIIQRFHRLQPQTLRFHRMLGTPKTCPGTSVIYEDVLKEVQAFHLAARLCEGAAL